MAFGSEPHKRLPNLGGADTSRRINHIADLESVELARRTNGIGTHIVEAEPVPNLQPARQHRLRRNAIDGVACRAPDAADVRRLRVRNMERAVHREHIRLHDLVIEQDTVEGTVYAIIDVIYL